eukprot:gene13332-16252_t
MTAHSVQRPHALSIENLSLEFPTYAGAIKALDGVTIKVGNAEIVGLVGESGCGKSVSTMAATRLLPEGRYKITQGSIRLFGRDPMAMDEEELQQVRGKLVSTIFQEPMNALNPTIRIGQQLVSVIRRHEALGRKAAEAVAVNILADMLIPEPARIMRTGTSVVFISHNIAVVSQICDRLYIMYAGRIVESGPTRAVLDRPQHPYTRALLRCLPERVRPKEPLESIPGTVPNLLDPPPGCFYRPRCPEADTRCMEKPHETALPGGQAVSCWQRAGHSSLPSSEVPSVENLTVRFPGATNWYGRVTSQVHAVNNVDLCVLPGESLGIVGESGCGKSTLVQAVIGLVGLTSGRVLVDGHDFAGANGTLKRDLRQKMQIVFQDPQSSLDPRLPVWRLITEPLHIRGGMPAAALRARAEELAISAVFDDPAHPYTRTLLASVPSLKNSLLDVDASLTGELPNNRRLPAGCYYRERCGSAVPGCELPQALLTVRKADMEKASPHQARCHLHIPA